MAFKPNENFENQVVNILRKRVNAANKAAVQLSKADVPVDTGDLQDSIAFIAAELVGDEIVGALIADTPYALSVETRTPFLGPLQGTIEALLLGDEQD